MEPTADLRGRQYREALFDNRVLTHLSGLEQCLRYGPLEAPRTDVCHGDLTCSIAVGLGVVSRPGARVGFAGPRDARSRRAHLSQRRAMVNGWLWWWRSWLVAERRMTARGGCSALLRLPNFLAWRKRGSDRLPDCFFAGWPPGEFSDGLARAFTNL